MIKFELNPDPSGLCVAYEAIIHTAAWVIVVTTDGVVCVMPKGEQFKRGGPRYIFTGRKDVVDLYGGAGVGHVEINERTQDKANAYAGYFEPRRAGIRLFSERLIKLAAAAEKYHTAAKPGPELIELIIAADEYGRGSTEEVKP